jgi:hypothetical protein
LEAAITAKVEERKRRFHEWYHESGGKETIAARNKSKAPAVLTKKEKARAVLDSLGYKYKGSGLTANAQGNYVATYKPKKGMEQKEAWSKCPHVAALIFNLFRGGKPQHKLDFADLKRRFGLDQGELESQAQVLVDQSAKKRLAKAANKAKGLSKAKKPAR